MGANVAEREALYQKQGGARIRDAVTEIILVCRLSQQVREWLKTNQNKKHEAEEEEGEKKKKHRRSKKEQERSKKKKQVPKAA